MTPGFGRIPAIDEAGMTQTSQRVATGEPSDIEGHGPELAISYGRNVAMHPNAKLTRRGRQKKVREKASTQYQSNHANAATDDPRRTRIPEKNVSMVVPGERGPAP